MVLLFMRFALSAERLSVGVEPSEGQHQITLAHSQLTPPRAERCCVRRFFWPEASVTTARVGGTEGAAAYLGHRTEAGRALRDHYANRAALLALSANAVRRRVWLASIQKRAEDFHQLIFVDGATPQFEINKHVVGDRSGFLQGFDIVGPGVHDGDEFLHLLEIAQRLDAAGCGAGANRHQEFGGAPNAVDPLGIVRRGDRAFHQRKVVRTFRHRARGFGEIGDFDRVGDREEFVLAVQQAQLTTVAGGELPDRELGFANGHVRSPTYQEWRRCEETRTPGHLYRRTSGRTGNGRKSRSHISYCVPRTSRCVPAPRRASGVPSR